MFATVEDLAVRIPGGIPTADLPRAEAYLEDASSLIEEETGRDFADGVPSKVKRICLAAALRAWFNPDYRDDTTIADYRTRISVSGGVYLTDEEKRELAKFAASSGLWVQPMARLDAGPWLENPRPQQTPSSSAPNVGPDNSVGRSQLQDKAVGPDQIDDDAIEARHVADGALPVAKISGLADVAITGDYSSLQNLPVFADVALSGAYSDLSGVPSLDDFDFVATGVGAVSRTVEDKLSDVVSVRDFGAVGDGTTDDTAALNAALASGTTVVYIPAGTYKVSGSVSIPPAVSVIGEGAAVTTITATGSTATFATDSVVTKQGAAPVQIPDLAATASKGSATLTFATAHGLAAGDVILIYNPTDGSFNASRPTYRAGEFSTVAAVTSPTAVDLETPLYDTYAAANVDVYNCAGFASGLLSGFTVVAPGTTQREVVRGLTVTYAHRITLDDIVARGSGNASLLLDRCYKVVGSRLDCHQWYSSSLGTHYGLVAANVQDVDLSGSFTGWRHGISFGGGASFSIPCRAGRVHDFTARNKDGLIAAADWHGNCEWMVYENGQVYGGGFNLAGNNNRVSNCKMLGSGYLILAREVLGLNHVFESLECFTSLNTTTCNIAVNSDHLNATITKYGGRLIFRDIHIDAPNAQTHAINIRNRGFTAQEWDVLADGISYNAPNVTGSTVAVLRMDTLSGNAPTRVQATNFTAPANVTYHLGLGQDADAASLIRQSPLTGVATVTTDTNSGFVTASVAFPRKFDKPPSVLANPQQQTTGADLCNAFAQDISGTGCSLIFRRVDQLANFAGVAAVPINFTATLSEW